MSGTTAANLCSLFRGQKLLKLLTVGYALPEMPLGVGSKLELLWALCLPNVIRLPCLNIWATYMYIQRHDSVCIIAPRVMHFSAFIH